MSTTDDIRVGDLVKATLKANPEEYAVFRVDYLSSGGYDSRYIESNRNGYSSKHFDFEVLERPIDEELLKGARSAYANSYGFRAEDATPRFGEAIKAVVEFVRAYDKKQAER